MFIFLFLFQVWYLYLVMIRWFGIRVDILSVFFLASVAFISIPLATGNYYELIFIRLFLVYYY